MYTAFFNILKDSSRKPLVNTSGSQVHQSTVVYMRPCILSRIYITNNTQQLIADHIFFKFLPVLTLYLMMSWQALSICSWLVGSFPICSSLSFSCNVSGKRKLQTSLKWKRLESMNMLLNTRNTKKHNHHSASVN